MVGNRQLITAIGVIFASSFLLQTYLNNSISYLQLCFAYKTRTAVQLLRISLFLTLHHVSLFWKCFGLECRPPDQSTCHCHLHSTSYSMFTKRQPVNNIQHNEFTVNRVSYGTEHLTLYICFRLRTLFVIYFTHFCHASLSVVMPLIYSILPTVAVSIETCV